MTYLQKKKKKKKKKKEVLSKDKPCPCLNTLIRTGNCKSEKTEIINIVDKKIFVSLLKQSNTAYL